MADKGQPYPIDEIWTHELPHLDEVGAMWLLRKFGVALFPGIENAKIVALKGRARPDGMDFEQALQNRKLSVGFGGGWFDEHATPEGQDRKEGECCTTLVAKYLLIADDPTLERIIKFVKTDDLKGGGHPFDLSHVMDAMYKAYPGQDEEIIGWCMAGFEAKYQVQLQFLTETKESFEKASATMKVQGPHGQVTLTVLESDDEQVAKFARSDMGSNAAIIVQKHSNGHVQVFTDRQQGIRLHDLAKLLRIEEQKLKVQSGEIPTVVTTDWKTLEGEAMVPGAPEWYYHVAGQAMLNGSNTATDVPATKIPLSRIVELVQIGVDPNRFEESRAADCKEGVCNSTRKNPCPFYEYGLSRCAKVRAIARGLKPVNAR